MDCEDHESDEPQRVITLQVNAWAIVKAILILSFVISVANAAVTGGEMICRWLFQ